jgi:hypothetical protein
MKSWSTEFESGGEFERLVLHYALPLFALWIIEEAVVDNAKAQNATLECAAAMSRVGGTRTELWTSVQELFRLFGEQDAGIKKQVQHLVQFNGITQMLAYVLLSLDEHVEWSFSATLQIESASMAMRVLQVAFSGAAERFATAVTAIWLKRLNAARFRFRSPDAVRITLEDAHKLEPNERLKTVLSQIASSVDARVSDAASAWLQSTT